jgi:hypothetical protein
MKGLILFLALSIAGVAYALPQTLVWDKNPPIENITSYTVYYGKTSRYAVGFQGYDTAVDVGDVDTYTVEVDDPTVPWYFAVIACNDAGTCSDYSGEWVRIPTKPSMVKDFRGVR